MSVNFTSFGSAIYTCKVGKDAKAYSVHGDAMARLSEPINNLINGGFKEQQEKTIIWEHVSPDTFTRLCEFAYSGDYTTPKPFKDPKRKRVKNSTPSKKKATAKSNPAQAGPSLTVNVVPEADHPEEPQEPAKAVVQEPAEQRYDGAGIYTGVQATWDAHAEVFKGRAYHRTQSAAKFMAQCDVSPNKTVENFELVLVAHAELYVLATEKMMEPLRQLCLHKLHATLEKFNVDRNSINDIFQLIRYIFDDDVLGDSDALREMVAEFVAWRIADDNIGGRKYFMDLLIEEEAFLRTFWKYTFWRRMAKEPDEASLPTA